MSNKETCIFEYRIQGQYQHIRVYKIDYDNYFDYAIELICEDGGGGSVVTRMSNFYPETMKEFATKLLVASIEESIKNDKNNVVDANNKAVDQGE